MGIDAERHRLSQAERLEWLRHDLELTELVTVYLSDVEESHNRGIYCALIPIAQIEQTLSKPFWDFPHGAGIPGATVYYEGGEERVEYLRYGVDNGIEPLVISRAFHEMRDGYPEICEEFRLFHGLYHERKTDRYIKIDDDGSEDQVAIVEPNRVRVRLKEIRQFLAVKDMYLSIQFDYKEFSEHSLEKLDFTEDRTRQQDALVCWEHSYGKRLGSNGVFSWLLGKQLVRPLPKSKSGLWGFAEEPEKKHSEFIIGTGDTGDEITYTSNPDVLANNFGANPNAPHYLTAVHFRKQVLDKYYQQSSKYSVGDAILWCGSLWCMDLDNHLDDKVCAWLGDLGQNLPYREQLHWRQYNIPPDGQVSETYFRRQILAQATDSDRLEDLFKRSYRELERTCEEYLGWQLLLPLTREDEHHFQGMRVPATDEQSDFDGLVLSLAKILIDSLNEKQLNKLISVEQRHDLKGSIARLEVALGSCGVRDAADYISFLRNLQQLRSSAAAHRKGTEYRKVANDFGVADQSLRAVFAEILRQAVDLLDYLTGVVRSNQMRPS